MKRVFFYSALLLAGMGSAQVADLAPFHAWVSFITMTCLSYIMLEVGLDFTLDKSRLSSYGADFLIATMAAGLPWAFCAFYLVAMVNTPWKEAWLVGLFAAPTSAGVLFTLMAAAGLSATWTYQKARVLAIFDDLATVLFLIPLQILFVGLKPQLFISLGLILALYIAVYRWLHRLAWPTSKGWLLLYAIGVMLLCHALQTLAHIHLESLMPSFALGCALRTSGPVEQGDDPHSRLDQCLKALFMFLVGACLPHVTFQDAPGWVIAAHVIALTVLANLGKCFVLAFYQKETTLRQRWALSLALFPRGEVGAGVLLIALGYGLTGISQTLAGLCLALNLLLTSVFIIGVKKLLGIKAASR